MSAGRWTVYNRAKRKLFNGQIQLGVDVFKILLVQTTSNFATLTLSTVGSLTNQIASAGGYTPQGLPMVVTWTAGASAGAYRFSMAPVFLEATGVPIVNIRAAVIKNSAGQLLCYATMTTAQFALPAGSTITLAPVASGIFTLSNPVAAVSVTPSVGALAVVGQQAQVSTVAASLLTTLTLVNTSGSTQAANFVTPMFGHIFKKGDISAGTYPRPQTTGGVDLPHTAWSDVAWLGGSRKMNGFMVRMPSAIVGSGVATINMKNGGSAPQAPSNRTLAEVSALNLTLELTGIDNLSGVWISSLSQGIIDNDDVKVIGDGQAGKIWRIRQQFMQSGANHGQLECYWYVAALQNSVGGLYGFRVLPMPCQPWYNDSIVAAKGARDFSAALKSNGSTSGLTQPSPGGPKTFTAVGGSPTFTSTAFGYQGAVAVRLTTTGTLPAGLSLGTTVYIHRASNNTFSLHPTARNAVDGVAAIVPTDAGTGTHTMTPQIELCQFTCFFGGNTNGTWQYLQGGGSVAAESTIRVQFNKAYWLSTRLLPPYDPTLSPPDYATFTYAPNGNAALRIYGETTGEDDTIGDQPTWVGNHFMNQSAVAEQAVRTCALSLATAAMTVKDNVTLTIPVVNNTDYPGMPAKNPNFRWDSATGNVSGFTVPPQLYGAMELSQSHLPSPLAYALMTTGEPQYADLLALYANLAVMMRSTGSRNFTVGPTTHYGCCFRNPNQARSDAWTVRELSLAAGLLPDAHWENANIKTYLDAMCQASFDMINAYNALQSSFWQNNGIYHFRTDDAGGAPWQLSYLLGAVCFAYGVTEKAAALTFLNHIIKFPAAVQNDIGLANYTCYGMRMRQTDSGAGALVTAMNQIFYTPAPGGSVNVSGNAATDIFSFDPLDIIYTISPNDQVVFIFGAPTGLSAATVYFAVNVTDSGPASTKTFQLAATSGGTPLTFSAFAGEMMLRDTVTPAASWGQSHTTGSGYNVLARGDIRWAFALGATMQAGLSALADSFPALYPMNYTASASAAQYAYLAHF